MGFVGILPIRHNEAFVVPSACIIDDLLRIVPYVIVVEPISLASN